jgi:hypothetical protein
MRRGLNARGQGKKWWAVCGYNEGAGPNEGVHECAEDVMRPGDTLYYPRGFHHQATTAHVSPRHVS